MSQQQAGPTTHTAASGPRLLPALGWLLAGAMTFVGIVRLARSETVPLLIGLQGVSGWLLVPAYPLAIIALVKRRRVLAPVAVILALGQAALSLHSLGWHGVQQAPVAAIPFSLVTANVLDENPQIPQLAAELAALDADVVLLQEVTPAVLERLRGGPLWTRYRYRQLSPHEGFAGAAIFSRHPIVSGLEIPVAGNPMLEAEIRTPAGIVRVINVHTIAPLSTVGALTWRRQFAALEGIARATSTPLILAGDFNATLDHAPLERLVASGLRDAFVEAGLGIGATWPRWPGPIPPVMRLDHVMVSASVSVLSVVEQTSIGSDHRRLFVRLALAPTS